MKAFGLKEILVKWVFFFWLMGSFAASAKVVLIENNVTVMSFSNVEADFAPSVDAPGKRGTLYLAEPLDACSTLTNDIVQESNDTKPPFVLISRGGCNFDDKVGRAQDAGFKAVIVYNNEDEDLTPMPGNSSGIEIHAVFVSRESGEALAKHAGSSAHMELWIVPKDDSESETSFWFRYPLHFLIWWHIFSKIW